MSKLGVGFWDTRYSPEDYVYGRAPNDFLKSHAPTLPSNGDILCLADGEGRNGVYLASLGHRVTSVDISEVGIRKAEALARELNVPLTCAVADLAEYDLGSQRWDAVVSVFAHTPPPVRRRVHAAICGALRPGGRFVLEAYTAAQIGRGTGGPPTPEFMMSVEGLHDELAGMNIIEAREVVRDIVEGSGHTGDGAVVQLFARSPDGGS